MTRTALPNEVEVADLGDREGRLRAAGPTAGVERQSRFLVKLDLRFRLFSRDWTEMGTTEISERVWSRFLLESRGTRTAEGTTGTNPDLPHLFSKEDIDLLDAFVLWFEESARDGYTYRIPTTAEWLCAFVGTRDPEFAPQDIDKWFENKRRDRMGFNSKPDKPYGTLEPTTVRSRPENKTPTGLYDMEANVRELVRDGSSWRVIGGCNQEKAEDLQASCKASQPHDPKSSDPGVGVRLLRKAFGSE